MEDSSYVRRERARAHRREFAVHESRRTADLGHDHHRGDSGEALFSFAGRHGPEAPIVTHDGSDPSPNTNVNPALERQRRQVH